MGTQNQQWSVGSDCQTVSAFWGQEQHLCPVAAHRRRATAGGGTAAQRSEALAMQGTAAAEPAADGAGAQSRCASAGHRRRVVLPGMRSGTITEMCVAPPHAESTRRGRTRAETARTQIPERWRSSGEDETPLTSAPPWSSPPPRPAPARHAAALRNPRGRVLPPWLPPLPPCAPLPAREAPAGRHGRVLGRRWRRR